MPQLPIATLCRTYDDFQLFMQSAKNREAEIRDFENKLICGDNFFVSGYCAVCDREALFFVDFQYSFVANNGQRIPNWRERLVCPHCQLNNRMRAAAAFILSTSKSDDAIYLTEAITPLFRFISSCRMGAIGSEYLRDGTVKGQHNINGVRHEDATALTFSDDYFHSICSFDVLEHVPDYRQAMSEFFRCLRPGGQLLISVPLDLRKSVTVTRATIDKTGRISYLMEPEIHGDPINKGGALCFYNFGWDFLTALSDAGFTDAGILLFWDARLGYLGGYQYIIVAQKPANSV